MSIVSWLEEWYNSNCDGDWEHCYGVSIETLDNPGWSVIIELHETQLEGRHFNNVTLDNAEDDWFSCRVENSTFYGTGDSSKLMKILEIFKGFAENSNLGLVTNKTDSLEKTKHEKIHPKVGTWGAFEEKYVSKRKQFLLVYEDMNIWMTLRAGGADYIITDLRKSTVNIIESTENLLKNAVFGNKNIKKSWDDVVIYTITHGKELPFDKASYEEFLYELIKNKGCYKIVYKNNSYTLNYLDTNEYKQSGTITLSASFNSPEELIENARICGKRIQEVVEELLK